LFDPFRLPDRCDFADGEGLSLIGFDQLTGNFLRDFFF
jgi:hypothetical protein